MELQYRVQKDQGQFGGEQRPVWVKQGEGFFFSFGTSMIFEKKFDRFVAVAIIGVVSVVELVDSFASAVGVR